MTKPVAVINTHADHEENVERIAKLLGRATLRIQIFNLIYGRGHRPKTVNRIMEELEIGADKRQPVLNEINYLSKHKLVTKGDVPRAGRGGNEAAYGKVEFIMANKAEILKYVAKPAERKKFLPSDVRMSSRLKRNFAAPLRQLEAGTKN